MNNFRIVRNALGYAAVLIATAGPAGAATKAAAAASDPLNAAIGLSVVLIAIGLYIVPSVVASSRKTSNAGAVVAVNLLLGWTGIGWLIALILALTADHSVKEAAVPSETQARMDAITEGRFSRVDAHGIVPMAGEEFFYAQSATHGQFYRESIYNASTPALYVPLGHGVRARVGGTHGRSNAVQNFRWDAQGTVYFSNKRIVFKPVGQPSIVSIPYGEIVAYEAYPAGLALNVSSIGVQQFKTGDACIATLYQQIVQNGRTPGIGADEPSSLQGDAAEATS